ncbi:hydrogenase nickel incorporation protein HypB [Alteromonas confluentis]|uniref:Hydrogenase maturation factor HypB n=1 Tax=Alteromonas confluentis TaxID=1656094 RepID=A0A1E7ZDG3_9ALTE|nr:hydrogenase nickel incorporation protein HypB [Alteromonas confluentis]OFC71549.1 hydrogenase accessory protein HypB [Alteromonas confluentis]
MCTVCGCSEGEVKIEGHHHQHEDGHHHHAHDGHAHTHEHSHGHSHTHSLGHGNGHDHNHEHSHVHAEGHNIHFGKGPAHAHVPGLSQSRMIQIEQDILGKNDQYAARNRAAFARDSVLALNLVSSPGSGKTTLLTETIKALDEQFPMAVIEGDQQTANDADRIRETGVPAIQINTGKGCHLDAHMVGHAMENFDNLSGGVLFIENVGNLVCPSAFDLGEAAKVAILSVTEGEDKPLKYPDMFHAAKLMLLNKTDLLPHLDFDLDKCIDYARQVNPDIEIIQISARSGEGMETWLSWLNAHRSKHIRQRLEKLEAEAASLRDLL